MEKEKVIERVKKLLALAGNNPNVHEAAEALGRAQQLMLEHKLAQAELQSAGGEGPNISELEVDTGADWVFQWKAILMNVLAKTSCCEHFRYMQVRTDGTKRVRFVVIGTASDSSYVAYCYQYLCAEIERLCDVDGKGKGFKFRNAFRRGAVSAMAKRLGEARKNVVAAAADAGKALMVLRTSELAAAEYTKKRYPDLTSGRRATSVSDVEAFHRGVRAGERIEIPGQAGRPALGADPRKLSRSS